MVRAAAARVLLFPQRFIVAYAAQGLLTKPFLFIKTVAQFIFIAHAAQSAVIGVFFPAGAHISVVFAVRRKSGNRPVPNAPPLPYRVRRMLLHSVFTGRSGLLRRWGRCRLGRLRLCGGPLLVSLFPFLIVSALAAGCGAGQWLGFVFRPAARLMGIRAKGAGGVLLIGALGGFAPAAVAASEAVRTGQLTSRQASALLPACVCSGPSFVILTVGQQMLGSRAVGVRLFAAQLLAGYLTAALLCRMQGGAGQAPPAQGETIPLPALDAVIAQAAVTYLKLCGFVLYFRLLAAGCGALLPQPWAALPAMLLEVCSGCDQAARTGLWASTLCCAALSVQGVSVLLQVRTICPAEISLRPLLAARAVHLPLSVALFWLGSTVPVQAVQTFTTLTERVVVLRRVPLDCALLAFAVCCITVEELARS